MLLEEEKKCSPFLQSNTIQVQEAEWKCTASLPSHAVKKDQKKTKRKKLNFVDPLGF